MIEIFKDFTFDAAHHLAANVTPDHPYARMHGHSFYVSVTLRGEPDTKTGWLMDFAELDKAIRQIHDQLDHRCLNDVENLAHPTLENISRWIWNRLKPQLPHLSKITVKRGANGEGCAYSG